MTNNDSQFATTPNASGNQSATTPNTSSGNSNIYFIADNGLKASYFHSLIKVNNTEHISMVGDSCCCLAEFFKLLR